MKFSKNNRMVIASLIDFPSVSDLARDDSFKEEISETIIEGLSQIYIDCIQSNNFEYNATMIKRELIEDEGVEILGASGWGQDNMVVGPIGQSLLLSINVSAIEVATQLSSFLNYHASKYLISKIKPTQIYQDLISSYFSNIISMMKSDLKSVTFENDEIESFVKEIGLNVDYVSKNHLESGSQYFQRGYLTLKDIRFVKGDMSFLIEVEEYYHVEGANY